jgi:exonuclease III
MEKGVSKIDFVNIDTMIQVHDYEGVSIFSRNASTKAATKELINIMQDNYPEMLVRIIFISTCYHMCYWSFINVYRPKNSLSISQRGEVPSSSLFALYCLRTL